jgi:hypothetical protein
LQKAAKHAGGTKMKIRLVAILLFGWAVIESFGQTGYPVPEKTDKILFYFQRSHNKNTVIYELNTLPDGKLNTKNPINFYWIRFEEGGVKKELSFIQKKAFGIDCKLMDKEKGNYVLHFNHFKTRDIYLIHSNNKYKAFVTINGEFAELSSIYIQSENNSLGFPLTVKYVELKGTSVKNMKACCEKIIPKS